MINILQIFLTSALTVLGGVVIYVLGQIASKFFIEPIHAQREIIGQIADALIYYANVYSNPDFNKKKIKDEAYAKLRQLSALLQSKTYLIPNYKYFERWHIVLPLSSINIASKNLIGLSNSSVSSSKYNHSQKNVEEIRKELNLYDPDA